MNLTVNQPLKEYTYWEDVWPMKGGLVIGKVQGQYALEKVVILTDSGTTVCGNSTEIFCEFPAHEGKNQITITAIDTKGNKVYETRNFTVNLGLPPPPLITVFGKVTDMFEKPVPNATVTVVSVYGGISESDSTQTSENGSYRLEYVLPHKQIISVEKEGYPEKSWDLYFENSTNEFNMHIDIDRSIPQGTATGTLSLDETNASRMQTRPAPLPLSVSLVAIGIVFAAVGILRKNESGICR